MRLFIGATASLLSTVTSAACSANCDPATIEDSITNNGPGSFSVICDEERTEDGGQWSNAKDVYSVMCDGELLKTLKFPKKKASSKCNQQREITCGETCTGCDPAELLSHVINENDGVPGTIGVDCVRSKNSKKAFWRIYCDADNNGAFTESSDPLSSVMTNKCNPVSSLNSLWEINCGDGERIRQCGADLGEAAAIRNGNQEPLPVLAECMKVLSAKKTRWKYTCDLNQNGAPDDDEHSLITVVNQNRFNNVDFDCGTHDDCFACSLDSLASFVNNKETENPGGIVTECVETLWGTGKARYRYWCDANSNGVIDDGESVKEVIVKQDEEGVCTRGVFDMTCKASTVETTSSTTTTAFTTQTSTDQCYNCFNLGAEDGSPFESYLVNTNPEPIPPTLTCKGRENENQSVDEPDNTGRFVVEAHCDLNQDGVVDEGETVIEVIGKKREATFCGIVSPTSWEIDCGTAACPNDACNADALVSGETFYTWDETIVIKAECLGRTSKNNEDWRFWCDDNGNGLFDEAEKSVVETLKKTTCAPSSSLVCGKSPTGQCSPFPEFSCTREDVLTSPNTDWYDLNSGNLNLNWENLAVYRQNGYEGNIQAECSEIVKTGTELWTVYCDDNNNGVLDVDEKSIQTEVKHERAVGKTDSLFRCQFDELRMDQNFICGDYEMILTDVLKGEQDFIDRGLEPKAEKQCGFQYMGPRYYGAPQSDEYDKETGVCTDEGMANAQWESQTAGNPIVSGAGFIQQGLGRDFPYAIAYEAGYKNKNNPDKNPELENYYNLRMSSLYSHYIPCYREMDKLGGQVIQYTQMYSLSKGERLFGWESSNVMESSNEAYLFYMRNFLDGFFYDISPIQVNAFWKKFDEKRMKDIHEYTTKLFADYSDNEPWFITNTAEIDTTMRSGTTTIMSYEGQLGVLPQWLNSTYYKVDPETAGTLWAHVSGRGKNAAHFKYGNLNYQQLAVMNSVTNQQVADLEAAFPGVDYLDHVIELMKRTRAGSWTISHYQAAQDCASCDEGVEEGNGSTGHDHESGYREPDYAALFSRPEMQPCPGVIGEWNTWSNCDRSCGGGIKLRTRECSDPRGPGYCREDERELALCNTHRCWSTDVTTGKYTQWSEWSTCSATCGEGQQIRTRICESELPLSCNAKDAQTKSCNVRDCPVNVCEKIRMATEYFVPCDLSDEICEAAPWWFKERQFFRFTGNYYLIGQDEQDYPIFAKQSNDIRMYYNHAASSWVIKNDEQNMIFAVSGHNSPTYVPPSQWNIKLDNEFVNGESVNASFSFECITHDDGEQLNTELIGVNGAEWAEWPDKWGGAKCNTVCGDIADRTRTRQCSVEDLCVGPTTEVKRCNTNAAPLECPDQRGECDSDGFRAIYWQYLDQPGLPNDFKDKCYNQSMCAYQHNPPVSGRNFMNLNNLEQFKQDDNNGDGFYEFKFEWVEKEDNIQFFDFDSGNSSMVWKQRQHMLEAVNVDMAPYDIVAHNHQGPVDDILFQGLSWSNDRNFHIMFDGIIDIGVNYTNGAGKQSRNTGWKPLWSVTNKLISNQKFYSVGSLETYQYAWPLWMGGWISASDVGNVTVVNGEAFTDGTEGLRVMPFVNYQRVLFRSPKYTVLKVKDTACST